MRSLGPFAMSATSRATRSPLIETSTCSPALLLPIRPPLVAACERHPTRLGLVVMAACTVLIDERGLRFNRQTSAVLRRRRRPALRHIDVAGYKDAQDSGAENRYNALFHRLLS